MSETRMKQLELFPNDFQPGDPVYLVRAPERKGVVMPYTKPTGGWKTKFMKDKYLVELEGIPQWCRKDCLAHQ